MKNNRKKKKVFTKLEKFIYKTSFVIMFSFVLGIVFTSAAVSKLNIELQEISKDVDAQKDINQSLVMKINEMASLENIQLLSKDLGLSYNNDNIKTIE